MVIPLHMKNIYHPEDVKTTNVSSAVNAYLDDITWFAPSISTLEKSLSIADSFYSFSNMKVNFLKFKILTNVQALMDSPLTLHINDNQFTIHTMKKSQVERFLRSEEHTSELQS